MAPLYGRILRDVIIVGCLELGMQDSRRQELVRCGLGVGHRGNRLPRLVPRPRALDRQAVVVDQELTRQDATERAGTRRGGTASAALLHVLDEL